MTLHNNLEENQTKTFCDISHNKLFLVSQDNSNKILKKVNKWDLKKHNFCIAK